MPLFSSFIVSKGPNLAHLVLSKRLMRFRLRKPLVILDSNIIGHRFDSQFRHYQVSQTENLSYLS